MLDVLDQGQDLRLGGDVQRRGRLVGDQDVRLQRQGHGDHDTLALSARQLVRIGIGNAGMIRQADRSQQLGDTRVHLCGMAHAVRTQHFADLASAAHQRIERAERFLEHHGDALAPHFTQLALGHAGQLQFSQPDITAGDAQAARQ